MSWTLITRRRWACYKTEAGRTGLASRRLGTFDTPLPHFTINGRVQEPQPEAGWVMKGQWWVSAVTWRPVTASGAGVHCAELLVNSTKKRGQTRSVEEAPWTDYLKQMDMSGATGPLGEVRAASQVHFPPEPMKHWSVRVWCFSAKSFLKTVTHLGEIHKSGRLQKWQRAITLLSRGHPSVSDWLI